MPNNQPQYTLEEIARHIGAETILSSNMEQGREALEINGLATLQKAQPHELTFLSRSDYVKYLPECEAAAVIINKSLSIDDELSDGLKTTLLRVNNSYLSYAKASELFARDIQCQPGVHASAFIDETADVAVSAYIAANVVVEAGACIGEGSVIGAGCVIGKNTQIGQNCLLHAQVTLYHDIQLGDQVILHSGVVIGSDGFGFAPKEEGGWQKIHQLGAVHIGNRVEIGANTTVDRGALEDTVIEDGVIIDNQVQIAHNVYIGENTAIAACTAIAGSAHIGAHCTIAGAVGIVGHVSIANRVHITAMTMVTKSIDQAGSYSSGTPMQATGTWRRNAVRFGQLDTIAKQLKGLKKQK